MGPSVNFVTREVLFLKFENLHAHRGFVEVVGWIAG